MISQRSDLGVETVVNLEEKGAVCRNECSDCRMLCPGV
jgi:hypothetical protein